eukprot:m.233577 g.233577  ORF g.233577 m.233577 type:complete len:1306 (+) comp10882_c0_seq1:72-3989(+)
MAAIEGWLFKMNPGKFAGKVKTTWKRRYFKTMDNRICYFKNEHDSKVLGYVQFVHIREVHPQLFTSVPERRHLNCGFTISTYSSSPHKGRSFNLLTDNAEDRDQWVQLLGEHVALWRDDDGATSTAGDTISLNDVNIDLDEDDQEITSKFNLDDDDDDDSDSDSDSGSSRRNMAARSGMRETRTRSQVMTRPNGRSGSGSTARPPASPNPPRNAHDSDDGNGSAWTMVDLQGANEAADSGLGMRTRSAAISASKSRAPTSSSPQSSPTRSEGSDRHVSFAAETDVSGASVNNSDGNDDDDDDGTTSAHRRRSAALSATSSPARSNSGARETSGFTSAGAVKVWIDFGDEGHRPLSTALSQGATAKDLFEKITAKMDASLKSAVQLWEVQATGQYVPLDDSRDPFDCKRVGSRIYLLSTDRHLLIIFMDDGSFVPLVVTEDITAGDVCQGPSPELREKLLDIVEPGLFLRKNGRDQLFHEDDQLVPLMQEETDSTVKLLLKSRSLRRRVNTHLDSSTSKERSNSMSSTSILRSFLFKKGNINSAWKKRWCTFQDGQLRYYRRVEDREPSGTIFAKDIANVLEAPNESAKDSRYPHCFEVSTTGGRDYMFCAETQALMQQWIREIERTVTNAQKVGYLYKKGFNNHAWKRRWFVLRGSDLSYYENQGDKTRRGVISLAAVHEITSDDSRENGFQISTEGRVYYLRADSMQEREAWMNTLNGVEQAPMPVERIAVPARQLQERPRQQPSPQFETPQSQRTRATTINTMQTPDSAMSFAADPHNARAAAKPPPVQLPEAAIKAKKSRSANFNQFADRDWTVKEESVVLSPSLASAMQSGDALDSLFSKTPTSTPKRGADFTPLQSKLSDANSDETDSNLGEREMTDDDLRRLGLLEERAEAEEEYMRETQGASRVGTAAEVPSPAVLKMYLQQSQHADSAHSVIRINLSGVMLMHRNGAWEKDPVCNWHEPPEEDEDAHTELFSLPPNIKALYHHPLRRWFVCSDLGYAVPMPEEPRGNPVVREWIKHGGLKFVTRLHAAVEEILVYYSSASLSPVADRANLLDDSKHETIGHLVRKNLCSALAQILVHGLLPTRMAGLIKNTVWTFVVASCPKPTVASTATAVAAHRVVKDLQQNQMMKDDHMRFRSFVCASLNHKFLEYWLDDVYNNESLLAKYFEPGAFLRTCPGSVFEELLLGINPLMVLNFRLYTSFELQRRMSVARQWSPAHQRPRSATSVSYTAPAPQARYVERVRAIYDVHDVEEDELAFSSGDILIVELRVDNDWLMCRLGKRRGLVPANYVESLNSSDA